MQTHIPPQQQGMSQQPSRVEETGIWEYAERLHLVAQCRNLHACSPEFNGYFWVCFV